MAAARVHRAARGRPAPAPARTHRRARRAAARACVGSGGSGGSSDSGDGGERELSPEEWDRALAEASMLLAQATRMAEAQTRAELGVAFALDASDAAAGAGGRMPPSDSGDEGDAAVSSVAERVAGLARFLCEGMGASDALSAERLAASLVRAGSPYAHPEMLEQKVRRLQNTLALDSLDVMSLVLADAQVLHVDAGSAVRRLLEMLAVWPAGRAACALSNCPRLLYVEDFSERYAGTQDALVGLMGVSEADAAFCLSEEPGLLWTLLVHTDPILSWRARDIAELPMSVQNDISFGLRSKYAL